MSKRVVGIDYGLGGAIAYLEEPARGRGKDRVHTLYKLTNLYVGDVLALESDLRGAHVFVESFMLRFANESQRRACIRWGELWERLRWLGAKRVEVRAVDWKKALGLTARGTYAGRKKAALARAREWWPGQPFLRADQAEAALIAEYGWRQLE